MCVWLPRHGKKVRRVQRVKYKTAKPLLYTVYGKRLRRKWSGKENFWGGCVKQNRDIIVYCLFMNFVILYLYVNF